MNVITRLITITGIISLLLVTLSCSLTTKLQQNTEEISPGTGSTTRVGDLFLQPTTGLAQLTAYKASLKQDLTGTLDGQPYERHIDFELSKQPSSEAFDYSNTVSGTDTRAVSMRLISLDGAFYEWDQTQSECQGSNALTSSHPVSEPASMLLPVNNGLFVGKEIVNGINASHYTFDRSSLSVTKGSEDVTGELWIADDGGYVIKYLLNVALPEKITGKDLEIAQSWVYLLELLDQKDAISLPEGCRAVPVEITTPDGSVNINYGNGSLTFETSTKANSVVDFYLDHLSSMGWESPEKPLQGAITAPFLTNFKKGNQILTLYLSKTEESLLNVELHISSIPDPAVKREPDLNSTPTGDPVQEPTIDPAYSELPEDIPLYPGSFNLINVGEMVMFIASEPIDVVASFYQQQLTANEWTLTNEISASNTVTQTWSKNNTELLITLVFDDGNTRIVISLPK